MLSIHYSGQINTLQWFSFINELKDIAMEMQWKYEIVKADYYYGIIIQTHLKCEPFSFLFNLNGQLVNILALTSGKEDDSSYSVSVKTNFSTVDNHIAIVNLLRYVKQKYIPNIKVIDEGDYWETQNRTVLQEKFNFLLQKLDEVTNLLEKKLPVKKEEKSKNMADRIEQIIKRINLN